MPMLMWLFATPFITSAFMFLLPAISGKNFKRLAFCFTLLPLLLLLANHSSWVGSNVQYAWLPTLSIEFHLSVDSLSLLFLYLTAIIVPISLFALRSAQLPYPNVFYGFVLLLQGLLIGFF